jgi:hypothetical protein
MALSQAARKLCVLFPAPEPPTLPGASALKPGKAIKTKCKSRKF